jgi:iron complex transport system permease protein
MKTNKNFLVFILALVVFFITVFSLFYKIDIDKIFVPSSIEHKIFFQIRIPRFISSFFVGAGLSVVGCVLQSIFLNPLCDGYTLGISSSAGLGVILITLLNIPLTRFFGSFLGVAVSLFVVFVLLKTFKKTIDISFVLAGIVLNFFFSSFIVLLTMFFDPYRLHYILLWLLGSFSSLDRFYVYVVSSLIIVFIFITIIYSHKLDIIILGREKSLSLGVDEQKVKNILLFISVIISALCVSLVGVISFVGVIIPNFVKMFIKLNHKYWVLYSAFIGGIFVSFCDTLAKNLFSPIEVPISVFTGLLGSVFFVFYLFRSKEVLWKF